MSGEGTLDYELYLNTKALLSCQSKYEELCNPDELQFQLVHQIEELWMKLIAYTLLDIDEYLQQENTNRVVTLFRRVHIAQKLMKRAVDVAGNDVAERIPGDSKAAGEWKRAGVAGIPRPAENVSADLEFIQGELSG